MTHIGVTGHANLTPDTALLVERVVLSELASLDGLTGVSCLAPGADQLFARAVVYLGGRLEVVLPARDYRDKIPTAGLLEYDNLLAAASVVSTMAFRRSGRDAYLAASEYMLSTVDSMFAVWDGLPATGRGGTGDVVHLARVRGLPVRVIWPLGAARHV